MKKTFGILLAGFLLMPALSQAVSFSMAGAGATHIPIIMPGSFVISPIINNTNIAELVAASPGKELLDVRGFDRRTGFVNNIGPGTVTAYHQIRVHNRSGVLLKSTPNLVSRFNFGANMMPQYFHVAGVADVGATQYAVSASYAATGTTGAPSFAALYSAAIDVINFNTGVRAKRFVLRSTAVAAWKILTVQVTDANGDGKDDLVVQYERPVNTRTQVRTDVLNLLTGALISRGYYIL